MAAQSTAFPTLYKSQFSVKITETKGVLSSFKKSFSRTPYLNRNEDWKCDFGFTSLYLRIETSTLSSHIDLDFNTL